MTTPIAPAQLARTCIALLVAGLVLFAGSARAAPQATQVLETANFRVTIDPRCEEGEISCADVKYIGLDKRSGQSLRLTGATQHTMCRDGVTPCRFLGYRFKNGGYTYLVDESGTLSVERGGKVLMQEKGEWQ